MPRKRKRKKIDIEPSREKLIQMLKTLEGFPEVAYIIELLQIITDFEYEYMCRRIERARDQKAS